MDEKVVISVLICTYNQEKYIASAIESAVGQIVDVPIEILIGDDCSTDNTRSIIQTFAERYPNKIRLIYPEKNLGATQNLLNLIEASQGEFLAMLDGDDVWLDLNKLQKQLDIMLLNPSVGMVCSKAKVWNENKQQYTGVLGDASVESFMELVKGNLDVAAPTIFLKKDLMNKCISSSNWYIKNNLFFDTVISYWFAYYSKIVFITEELAMYRVLLNSGCHTSNKKTQREYDKRYFAIKTRFLMENNIPIEIAHEILLLEWEKTFDSAAWQREIEVRQSKAFRIGYKLLKPIKIIKNRKG